ncbi:8032_t:CDS:2 [Acaulospora morrowiae]|uniref:8032_t:CDS:1 n=1 Tax=Acaulospora morrowiae TaxID=94023 RepID=A0A9N9DK51_9GLOM|nr:8032_t:CDS:2 [Acaulospora morrowiae]
MATPKEITIPAQPMQYNSIGMPYPSQLEKLKEKQQQQNELKSLLAQFGSKAKATDELEQDASKLRGNIANLLTKVQSRGRSPQTTVTSPIIQMQSTSENRLDFLLSIVFFPITIIRNIINAFFNSINRTAFLTVILLIELAIVYLIWASRRAHHTYLYVEPYEAVIHGTYGADQSTWSILRSTIISIQDFFAEVMNGGRGFGSPSYDGFVPI